MKARSPAVSFPTSFWPRSGARNPPPISSGPPLRSPCTATSAPPASTWAACLISKRSSRSSPGPPKSEPTGARAAISSIIRRSARASGAAPFYLLRRHGETAAPASSSVFGLRRRFRPLRASAFHQKHFDFLHRNFLTKGKWLNPAVTGTARAFKSLNRATASFTAGSRGGESQQVLPLQMRGLRRLFPAGKLRLLHARGMRERPAQSALRRRYARRILRQQRQARLRGRIDLQRGLRGHLPIIGRRRARHTVGRNRGAGRAGFDVSASAPASLAQYIRRPELSFRPRSYAAVGASSRSPSSSTPASRGPPRRCRK